MAALGLIPWITFVIGVLMTVLGFGGRVTIETEHVSIAGPLGAVIAIISLLVLLGLLVL